MAAQQSRDVLVKYGDGASPEVFTTIAGVTSKSFNGTNNLLDVTTDDEDGVRTLLAGNYTKAYELSVTLTFKDDATFTAVKANFDNGTINNYQIVLPGSTANGTYEGGFMISSFNILGGGVDDKVVVEATLASSGAITFT